MITVTTDKYAGIAYTALVDSGEVEGNVVLAFRGPQELNRFLAGTYAGQPLSSSGVTDSSQPGVIGVTTMSDQELIQLLKDIANEQDRRRQK